MASFYKSYLDTTSKAHDLAVAASLTPSTPSFNISAPPPTKYKSEADLAAEVSSQTGRKIEVNDDGIIIDKRELFAGGLNIVAKPKPAGSIVPGSVGRAQSGSVDARGAGDLLDPKMSAAERGRLSRERHSREIERQMGEMENRKKREAEESLSKEVQKVAKRNDETKVEELKRKAEERRLKRELEAKDAAGAGSGSNP